MGENDNIPQMTPSFENICRKDEYGNKYWSSRDLCGAMGYSAYWKFQRVIDKAIKVAGEKGMNVDEHFNQAVDMVKIGNGSFRKVNIFRLSRMACMIIAENADGKKLLVHIHSFFSGYFNGFIYDSLKFPISRITHRTTKVTRTPVFIPVFILAAYILK